VASLGVQFSLNGHIKMRLTQFTIVLSLFICVNTLFGQNARVYNTYSIQTSVSNQMLSYSIAIGQSLELHNKLPLRIHAALQMYGSQLKSGSYSGDKSSKIGLIQLNKNLVQTAFSVPISVEIPLKNMALGISQEIISFKSTRKLDSTDFDTISEYLVSTTRLNHLFSSRNKNTLRRKLYLNYTFNEGFSFQVGIERQKTIFNFQKTTTNSEIEYATAKAFAPFLSARINIEK
jgi:hypothetical protein